MKSVISLLLLFPLSVSASPIHLFYEGDVADAKMYQDILIKDYQIPEDLILMRKTSQCEGLRSKGKLDLCLKNNGDLLMVSVDREFINESLKVFQAP
jgi:hypothetical protein